MYSIRVPTMFIVKYIMYIITTMHNSVLIRLYATIIGLMALLITLSKLGLVVFIYMRVSTKMAI